MITDINTQLRYDFHGSERDFEAHVADNLDDISKHCGWGEISHFKQQFTLKMGNERQCVDIMIWHKDGTGTLIECKTGKTNRHDVLTAMGQAMFYGTNIKYALGQMPRLVIASPKFSQHLWRTISTFELPINLLVIDGDRCVYTGCSAKTITTDERQTANN